MLVREGWSTEFARLKFDVEASEVDLQRLLTEHGYAPEEASRLTTAEAFRLLRAEVEVFSLASAVYHKEEFSPGKQQADEARLERAREARSKLHDKVFARLDGKPGAG